MSRIGLSTVCDASLGCSSGASCENAVGPLEPQGGDVYNWIQSTGCALRFLVSICKLLLSVKFLIASRPLFALRNCAIAIGFKSAIMVAESVIKSVVDSMLEKCIWDPQASLIRDTSISTIIDGKKTRRGELE